MSEYLYRFKGQYRLRVPYDEATGEWSRDLTGNLDTNDVYIECEKNGDQIYDIDSRHSLMQAYISTVRRGKKIVKQIIEDYAGQFKLNLNGLDEEMQQEREIYYTLSKEEKVFRDLPTEDDILFNRVNRANGFIISDIEVTDGEVLFNFKVKYIEEIAKYMKPRKPYKSTSPFLKRYLPRDKEEERHKYNDYTEMPTGYWDEIMPLKNTYAKLHGVKPMEVMPIIYAAFEEYVGIDIIDVAEEDNYKVIHQIHRMGLYEQFAEWLKLEVAKGETEEN